MDSEYQSFLNSFTGVWMSGGWLMLPLFCLAVFIYYTAIDLYLRVRTHFLNKACIYKRSDTEIMTEISGKFSLLRAVILPNSQSATEVRCHFREVRKEYLPIINRRIRFLAIITTTSPLVGLLGTVTGMLSTFSGMVDGKAGKFESVVQGISEALITTQTGLMISIPALIVLSLIVQSRNRLLLSIARLEYINIKLAQHASLTA